MYHVKNWDTDEIHYSFEQLSRAKKYARGMGHTGIDDPILTGYMPVARVVNDAGECVYNPRFGKLISSSVGGFIDSIPGGQI